MSITWFLQNQSKEWKNSLKKERKDRRVIPHQGGKIIHKILPEHY